MINWRYYITRRENIHNDIDGKFIKYQNCHETLNFAEYSKELCPEMHDYTLHMPECHFCSVRVVASWRFLGYLHICSPLSKRQLAFVFVFVASQNALNHCSILKKNTLYGGISYKDIFTLTILIYHPFKYWEDCGR